MSSFVAHALVGATPGALARLPWPYICILVVLAWLPDVDYFWLALGGAHPTVRVTHSLGFVLGVWALCGVLLKLAPKSILATPHQKTLAWASLVALLSHLMLDFMVGGDHGDPLLWPLSSASFTNPWGFLPAAGSLHPGNFYLWRNLLIELGILVPVILALQMVTRRQWRPWILVVAVLVCVFCTVWGFGLAR